MDRNQSYRKGMLYILILISKFARAFILQQAMNGFVALQVAPVACDLPTQLSGLEAPVCVDARLPPLHPKACASLALLAAGHGSLFAGMDLPLPSTLSLLHGRLLLLYCCRCHSLLAKPHAVLGWHLHEQ